MERGGHCIEAKIDGLNEPSAELKIKVTDVERGGRCREIAVSGTSTV